MTKCGSKLFQNSDPMKRLGFGTATLLVGPIPVSGAGVYDLPAEQTHPVILASAHPPRLPAAR